MFKINYVLYKYIYYTRISHSSHIVHYFSFSQRMNNAAKAEASKEKTPDNRKPQNSEMLRSQEQKVAHDKVSCLQLYIYN